LTKTNQTKRPKKRKPEFSEGHSAHQDFEKTMKALFGAPKSSKKGEDYTEGKKAKEGLNMRESWRIRENRTPSSIQISQLFPPFRFLPRIAGTGG
jgi:hypothetical protein